jgi:hypothetical protein
MNVEGAHISLLSINDDLHNIPGASAMLLSTKHLQMHGKSIWDHILPLSQM